MDLIERRPTVSVITPAFNAAGTIGRMFDSLSAQRRLDWEQIVVDDGSTDDTRVAVERHLRREPRARLVSQHHAGASAARNRGLTEARGEWVLFLDADDTLARGFLPRMLARATASPAADVVLCGYRRRDANGRVVARYAAPAAHTIATICRERPPTAIHAALFRRTLLERIGGFDEALATREDWELWRRIAGSGAALTIERRCLVDYWHSTGSLTGDATGMIRDAADVLGRAGAGGLPDDAETARGAMLSNILWAGAAAIGGGRDAPAIGGDFAVPAILPDETEMVDQLLDGLMVGSGSAFAHLAERWGGIAPRLDGFLAVIAERTGEDGLDRALARAIEAEVVRTGRIAGIRQIGGTLAVPVRVGLLLRGFTPPAGCEALLFKVPLLRPRGLFVIAAAPSDRLGASELRRLLARGISGGIVARLLASERFGVVTARSLRGAAIYRRVLGRLTAVRRAPSPTARPEPGGAMGEQTPGGGSGESWDAFFQAEDPWNYGSAYEQLKYERTLSLIPPDRPIGRALELACAEGMFTTRLAPRVERLQATDISQIALDRAEARCRQAGVANAEFAPLDFFNQPISTGWDLIVASEVLYYMGGAGELDGFVDKIARGLNPDGLFLHAHAHEVTDDPGRTGFDWGDPFGVQTITRALQATSRLERVRAIETDLYRIELYRRIDGAGSAITGGMVACQTGAGEITKLPLATELDVAVASSIVWNGAIQTRQDVEETRTCDVPVLMYHRIAANGPTGLAEWRTSAEGFEHQLRFLRRRGYRSLAIEEWEEARHRAGALSGRPVLITFDDAYRDFHDVAWPILERNGFSAHVFVVTGKVGGTSDWDARHGDPAPLMTWDEITGLHRRGATFGSHLETHRAANRLSARELLGEAARSRAVLEDRLSEAVLTIAPPYGAIDRHTRALCAAAGYSRLFEAGGGMAKVGGPPLATPRIDIAGHDDIATFATKIGRDDEPPEAGDLP